MRGLALTALVAAAGILPCVSPVQAQTMYKCLDAGRRVTYSNITCDKQGLNTAGTVQERVTSMPFTAPAKPAAAAAAAPAPAGSPAPAGAKPQAQNDAEVKGPAAQIKPVVPILEKLAK